MCKKHMIGRFDFWEEGMNMVFDNDLISEIE